MLNDADYDKWKLESPDYVDNFEETVTIKADTEEQLSEFLDAFEELKKTYGVK